VIELDVMLSRNRKVMVIHDATLERTTNTKDSVADLTLSELRPANAAGIRVFPYNVDTYEDFVKMRAMPVDGAITNDPAMVIGWSKIIRDRIPKFLNP